MNNPARTGPNSALDRETQALAHALDRHHAQRPSAARQLARGLGWFGIGLGLVELLASRRVARASGLRGGSLLLPLYGLREIASGAGLVTARNAARTAPWAWSRVAGDAIDIATLLAAPRRAGVPHGRWPRWWPSPGSRCWTSPAHARCAPRRTRRCSARTTAAAPAWARARTAPPACRPRPS